jgi:adenine-specific DNA-methyltransferase
MPEHPADVSTVRSEEDLVRLAVALGATDVAGPLSPAESAVVKNALAEPGPLPLEAERARQAIEAAQDPLGAHLLRLRTPTARREVGAIYTPPLLVKGMVDWIMWQRPQRVVDAGAGSGRFTAEVARRSRDVALVAVDIDPLATLITRAMLAVLGHMRAQVLHADYTRVQLPSIRGRTAFVGNPPYVRHHKLGPETKAWAQAAGRQAGHRVSGLAGLHAHFFLATALMARSGDVGCFVTSSEWLDVNYGSIIRELLLDELGGRSIHVLEPTALPFQEATTTAAITCFQPGERLPAMRMRSVKAVEDIGSLDAGEPVATARLSESGRWGQLVRTRQHVREGCIELGELCRVHRGAVTGLNSVWVTSRNEHDLPQAVLFPSVTRARELFRAGDVLDCTDGLKLVIDLPADLDVLQASGRRTVEGFLRKAMEAGAADGYIARNRRAWWAVGLRNPAPILATYMARRPPAFVRNLANARHINIAHGLYPRIHLPAHALDRLASALRSSITVAQGRTYAGGLTKFEPREMERLPIPDLATLLAE